MPRRTKWRQRWLLTALGLVFAVSAVLRIGTLDLAFAQAVTPPPLPDAAIAADSARPVGATQALRAALDEVEALRRVLQTREAEIADREQAVATATALIEDRLAELAAVETRLEALIATSDRAAETDLDRLTRIYETMPAQEAAAVFEQMQPGFAAGFLARMAPAASATLLAELSPEQAYAVSVVIATRNSSAPRLAPGETALPETEN
jgi:flagellar motility protein MotE (MotC chaperone)